MWEEQPCWPRQVRETPKKHAWSLLNPQNQAPLCRASRYYMKWQRGGVETDDDASLGEADKN